MKCFGSVLLPVTRIIKFRSTLTLWSYSSMSGTCIFTFSLELAMSSINNYSTYFLDWISVIKVMTHFRLLRTKLLYLDQTGCRAWCHCHTAEKSLQLNLLISVMWGNTRDPCGLSSCNHMQSPVVPQHWLLKPSVEEGMKPWQNRAPNTTGWHRIIQLKSNIFKGNLL